MDLYTCHLNTTTTGMWCLGYFLRHAICGGEEKKSMKLMLHARHAVKQVRAGLEVIIRKAACTDSP